jgi:hypothetical protein
LKVAATPAAAPQPISTLRCSVDSCTEPATAPAIEPPICAIGPSRPTAAPEPSEIAALSVFTIIQRRFTRAPWRWSISRKRGKP